MPGADDDDDDFRPPLPPEDRIWRHPAEIAASRRFEAELAMVAPLGPSVSTMRTPLRHAVTLTAVGAIGGALLVSGLFLTLGGSAPGAIATEPITQIMAVDPVVPVERRVDASEWPGTVAASVSPSVVSIAAGDRSGSGVVFRSDGLVLTSADLVGDLDEVEVGLPDGTVETGTVLGTDSISGLAVVEIGRVDLDTAPLGILKQQPVVGDPAVVVPAGVDGDDLEMGVLSATQGKIRVTENLNLHGLLQLDVGLPDRGSGAALVDDTGAVVGVVVDVGTRNASHAVPIGWARKIAEDILVWGEGRHPWLGIIGTDVGDEDRFRSGVDSGVVIDTVIADGPADRAGLQRGDILTRLGDRRVASMSELILELRLHAPDAAVEVEYHRSDGDHRELVSLRLRSDATATD